MPNLTRLIWMVIHTLYYRSEILIIEPLRPQKEIEKNKASADRYFRCNERSQHTNGRKRNSTMPFITWDLAVHWLARKIHAMKCGRKCSIILVRSLWLVSAWDRGTSLQLSCSRFRFFVVKIKRVYPCSWSPFSVRGGGGRWKRVKWMAILSQQFTLIDKAISG